LHTTMTSAAEEDASSNSEDGESHLIDLIDDNIHITDSDALIQVIENSSLDRSSNEAHDLRRQLAEFASELLRLQEQIDVEPRRTGAFAPEALCCWTELASEATGTPGGLGTPISSPATPSRNKQITTPLDSLPTPTSTSDGRSEAADLLRSRIQRMQLNDESGDTASENRIADFTGEGIPSDYEEMRVKKGEAEAEAALLSAELVALRGRHEEEKRHLIKTVKDVRRRNEELERRITMQRMGSSSTAGGGGAETANGRSASCSRITGGEDQEGKSKFGFGMRALAQRWASPHPRGSQSSAPGEEEEEEREATRPSDHQELTLGSSTSTINTNDDFGQVDFSDKETLLTVPSNEESEKLIAAFEEQLRQSEHHAEVLEQRLNIVKESGDAVIQSLNEELSDVAEDRARSETAMIKELSILDSQRRAERNEYEKRIQEWIVHDASRKLEVEEYETRIESLLGTVQMMGADVTGCQVGTKSSSSWDRGAEQEMQQDLIGYIELLGNANNGRGKRSLVMSINDAFDHEFNANPNVADEMLEYYRSRPELNEFTLKSELPRMDYEVLTVDGETGENIKLVSTDEIRSYFASLDEATKDDDEIDIILRAANQSLLADPLAMLTGEGDGKLVHSGSFHSTLIATVCSFKLDLRREGERRVKVQCELAICVPSGRDGSNNATEPSKSEEKEEKVVSATLELARANLVILFSPSPTATPSGPLVKYLLMDIKPTIKSYEEGSDNARAIQTAAAVLARDRNCHIQSGGSKAGVRPNVKSRLLSRVKQFSSRASD